MNHSYCCLPLRAAHFKTVTISVFIDILSFRTIMGFSHTYLQRNVLVIFVFLSIMTLSNIYMLPSSRLLQEYNRRPTIFQCLLNHHYLIISVSSSFILLSCSLHFGIKIFLSHKFNTAVSIYYSVYYYIFPFNLITSEGIIEISITTAETRNAK